MGFQFLIGTLKTNEGRQADVRVLEFQFLIGTLKTLIGIMALGDPVLFQFLIGTLKTAVAGLAAPPASPVSIPHRYAENVKLAAVSAVVYAGFNSS